MTRDETKTIIRAIIASYPTFKPDNLSETIDVWAMMLEDMDYRIIEMALKTYIRTNNSSFAPSIGQLMAYANKLTTPEELTGTQAWALVIRAVRNSAYFSAEEFAKLPDAVQKTIGSPERLRSMAIDDRFNEGVESSNFQRSYQIVLEREREKNSMSPDVLRLVQSINEGSPRQMLEQQNAERLARMQEPKLIETKSEGVPMPDDVREKMRELLGV